MEFPVKFHDPAAQSTKTRQEEEDEQKMKRLIAQLTVATVLCLDLNLTFYFNFVSTLFPRMFC